MKIINHPKESYHIEKIRIIKINEREILTMRYFVTLLSPLNNIGTLNWETQILDKYQVDETYWEQAKSELSSDTEWLTENQLYKKMKRNNGRDNEIILSRAASVISQKIQTDFPNANVWIYQ